MGLLGWRSLSPEIVTLRGRVRRCGYFAEDSDWSLVIQPRDEDEYRRLGVNSDGVVNPPAEAGDGDGWIECEICAMSDVNSDEENFFHQLVGRDVVMVGAWVEDNSHDQKTEIHPVMSIEVEGLPADEGKRRVEFFLFSNAVVPWNAPLPFGPPPFSDDDIRGLLSSRFPPVPQGTAVVPRFKEIDVTNHCSSRNFQVDEDSGQFILAGVIQSGRPSAGKGFYHGTVEMWLDAVNIDIQVLDPPPVKRLAQIGNDWRVVFDLGARVNVSDPSVSLVADVWTLQLATQAGQADLVSTSNPCFFDTTPLVRAPGGGFVYTPRLSASLTTDPQVQPAGVSMLFDLKKPTAVLECRQEPGRIEDREPVTPGAPSEKIVWTCTCEVAAHDFASTEPLNYEWTILPMPFVPGRTPQLVQHFSGVGLSSIRFDLEIAPPEKSAYTYSVSVEVRDVHFVESIVASHQIELDAPVVMIAGSLETTDEGTLARPSRYRFSGSAVAIGVYAPLRMGWEVRDAGQSNVQVLGASDATEFRFEFDYLSRASLEHMLILPAGPAVEILVRDRLAQTAFDSLDVSTLMSPLARERIEEGLARLRHSLQILVDMRPRWKGVIPPGIVEGLVAEIRSFERSRSSLRQPISAKNPKLLKSASKALDRLMKSVVRAWGAGAPTEAVKMAVASAWKDRTAKAPPAHVRGGSKSP